MSNAPSRLGVVVVSFNSADVILDCLESLLATEGAALYIVVIDNRSTDGTLATLKGWADGSIPYRPPTDLPFALTPSPKPVSLKGDRSETAGHSVVLLEATVNAGFAAGVNLGLAHLAGIPEIMRYWILNPDSVVDHKAPHAFATCMPGDFSLMGGRLLYLDSPEKIQIDGGLINRRTGVTGNKNQYAPPNSPPPNPADLDFITGASMVASRAFYEAAGPMPEDYFLYYEEVDWALRRGGLPLAYCPDAIVYHRAGTAIGSATLNRPASPFSLYFKHRARMRFMRRYYPAQLPIAFAYSCAKAAQLALKGYRREAWTLLLASLNRPAPAHVRAMLSDEAARLAFPEHVQK